MALHLGERLDRLRDFGRVGVEVAEPESSSALASGSAAESAPLEAPQPGRASWERALSQPVPRRLGIVQPGPRTYSAGPYRETPPVPPVKVRPRQRFAIGTSVRAPSRSIVADEDTSHRRNCGRYGAVMAVVEWGVEQREEVRTVAELDALLERLAGEARAAGMPQDVQLTVDGAGTLGMVVGDDRSVLNHVPDSLDPPYMVSVGNEASDEPVVFYVAGDHYSDGPRRNTIPPADAQAAMRHFLTTGELSPEVNGSRSSGCCFNQRQRHLPSVPVGIPVSVSVEDAP